MLEWLGILFGIVVLPAFLAWLAYTPGFVPAGTAVGTVVEVKTGHATVVARRRRNHTRYKRIRTNLPVVEYRLDGRRLVGTSMLPDFAEKLAPGDRVRVVVNRGDKGKIILAYWNLRP